MRWAKKKQKSKAVMPDRYDTCSFCKNQFNWAIQGVTNGNKEQFCNSECLRENYLKNVKEANETIPFDAL
jgi:hypothetical protein